MDAPYLVATTSRPSRQAAIILVSIDNFLSLLQASLFRFIIVLFHPEDQEWPINPVEMTIKRAKNLINTSSKHNLFSCVQPRLLQLNLMSNQL